MTSEKQVFPKVVETIVDVCNVNESNIDYQTDFKTDIGADSLNVIEIAMLLEDEFDISIEDEQLEKMLTVGDLVKYIVSKVK